MRGEVSSEWHDSEREFTLDIRIPVNSTAKVCVPRLGVEDCSIREAGLPIWYEGELLDGVEGVTAAHETDESIVFEVGSGSYSFRMRKN